MWIVACVASTKRRRQRSTPSYILARPLRRRRAGVPACKILKFCWSCTCICVPKGKKTSMERERDRKREQASETDRERESVWLALYDRVLNMKSSKSGANRVTNFTTKGQRGYHRQILAGKVTCVSAHQYKSIHIFLASTHTHSYAHYLRTSTQTRHEIYLVCNGAAQGYQSILLKS